MLAHCQVSEVFFPEVYRAIGWISMVHLLGAWIQLELILGKKWKTVLSYCLSPSSTFPCSMLWCWAETLQTRFYFGAAPFWVPPKGGAKAWLLGWRGKKGPPSSCLFPVSDHPGTDCPVTVSYPAASNVPVAMVALFPTCTEPISLVPLETPALLFMFPPAESSIPCGTPPLCF